MNIWPFATKTDKRLIPNKESQVVISRPQALMQMMSWLASVPDPDTLLQRVGIHRAQLRVLRDCFEECRATGLPVDTLSMGMSADLEDAIAEGATLVRVGTSIFGARG